MKKLLSLLTGIKGYQTIRMACLKCRHKESILGIFLFSYVVSEQFA